MSNDIGCSVTLLFTTDNTDILFRAQKISQPTKVSCDIGCRHCLLAHLSGFEPKAFRLGVKAYNSNTVPHIPLLHEKSLYYGVSRCTYSFSIPYFHTQSAGQNAVLFASC